MVKKSFGLALVLAGSLAMGCGDGGAKTNASAEPAKSGAAAAPGASGSAAAAAAPATAGAVAAPAAASGGDVLKYMPKTCAEGRIFLDGKKLLTGLGGGLEGLQTKLLEQLASSNKPDDKKATEVLAVFKEGGLDPVTALGEMAVCADAGNKVVAAISMDMSKVANGPDLFAKAMEKGSGKAPKKEEIDGVTYLTNDKDKVMAFPGGGVVILAESMDLAKSVAKGADGGSDFADAKSHVIWAKILPKPTEPVDMMLKEAGDNYELKVLATMGGPQGDALKKDPAGTVKQMEGMAQSILPKLEAGPFKAIAPAIKSAKFAAEGDRLSVSSTFPKAAITDLVKAVSEAKPEELMKAL